MNPHYDVAVIGGGIAGVSIAYELAEDRSVVVLEQEGSLALHTTGRSAATFLETYGGDQIRVLTTGSRAFLESPPEGFTHELLTPRPLLQYARHGEGDQIIGLFDDVRRLVPDAQLLDPTQVADLCPVIRTELVENALFEPGAMELEVHGLHQGYVSGGRARGTVIERSAGVASLAPRGGGGWSVNLASGGTITADVVVNAAGAWADDVAERAGAHRIGMRPLLRSIFMVGSPTGKETQGLPLVGDIAGTFYIKPEGDQFLCSPADETLQEPCDAKPDELEIARAIDDINEATWLGIRSVRSSWGGLRTFAPDRNFVIGFDPSVEGLFWFAGQGGYGIQTAPAAARLGAALIRGTGAPQDLLDRGLEVERLAPGRTMAPA